MKLGYYEMVVRHFDITNKTKHRELLAGWCVINVYTTLKMCLALQSVSNYCQRFQHHSWIYPLDYSTQKWANPCAKSLKWFLWRKALYQVLWCWWGWPGGNGACRGCCGACWHFLWWPYWSGLPPPGSLLWSDRSAEQWRPLQNKTIFLQPPYQR